MVYCLAWLVLVKYVILVRLKIVDVCHLRDFNIYIVMFDIQLPNVKINIIKVYELTW